MRRNDAGKASVLGRPCIESKIAHELIHQFRKRRKHAVSVRKLGSCLIVSVSGREGPLACLVTRSCQRMAADHRSPIPASPVRHCSHKTVLADGYYRKTPHYHLSVSATSFTSRSSLCSDTLSIYCFWSRLLKFSTRVPHLLRFSCLLRCPCRRSVPPSALICAGHWTTVFSSHCHTATSPTSPLVYSLCAVVECEHDCTVSFPQHCLTMPIFHDIVERPPSRSGRSPEVTEGSYEQDLTRFESRWKDPSQYPPSTARVTAQGELEGRPLSRGELIERIKRGSSPTWSFKNGSGRRTPDRLSSRSSSRPSSQASLLPAVELRESPKSPDPAEQGWSNHTAMGMEIERPRSALHSGDFREEKDQGQRGEHASALATSPVAPWHNDFPAFLAAKAPAADRPLQRRSRAPTHSSLSQFVLMPPTSPLVQATHNSDLDEPSSKPIPQRRSRSPQKENRRHTFSPQSLQAWGTSVFGSHHSTPRPVPMMRRESTFPYQAHQPRRSITSFNQLSQSVSNSTPQTPRMRPRGLSNASESSPLHHAPMVGSYEESILRGRMSTTPSRPLNFVAQIGVLGKGKCKSSLRCPPHAIVPFPAVFYSYGSGSGRITDNSPSPYVGLIDIENNVPAPKEKRDESRRRKRYASPAPIADQEGSRGPQPIDQASEASGLAMKRKRERLRKRSQSPKAPPGGSYRIPQQGQLQIIIKNPNKTAVKLFLVPYDLSDMEPGQKTFIRQRSYSAGPIIDMPMSARTNFGTDRPEASLCNSEDPRDRPVLRYLVHLHICCTGKGRYYLYKSIRVVFANRVPDGKEKLRNEIQLPEPKYSAYKPSRDNVSSHQNPATFALSSAKSLADERAARRRSTPFDLDGQMSLDAADGLDDWSLPSARSVKPIPFMLNRLETVDSRPSSRDYSSMETDNPFARRSSMADAMGSDEADTNISPTAAEVAIPTRSGRNDPNSAWEERRQNPLLLPQNEPSSFDLVRSTSPSHLPPKLSEGLLARQLRGLSVEREKHDADETTH